MKRKRPDLSRVAWTPFVEVVAEPLAIYDHTTGRQPDHVYRNSRYQVSVWFEAGPLGKYVHLSIKDHNKTARHDWRDFQRIKNEIVGPEFEGFELYPAESRLVDTANQYHVYVFPTRIPIGFPDRLVAEGGSAHPDLRHAVQRPFEERPADCLTGADLDAWVERLTGGQS